MSLKPLSLTLTLVFFCHHSMAQLVPIEKELANENYQQVIAMADSLLSEENSIHHARIFQMKADAFYYLGDLEQSIESYFKAINRGEKAEAKDLRLLLECYSHAGFCYREMGLYEKAFPHYERSLLLAQQIGDSIEIASQYYNLGTLYQYKGAVDLSTQYLDSAYQIDVARKDTISIGFDLSLLGELRAQVGDYQGALTYALESLSLYQTGTGNANSRANRINLIGSYFLEQGILDSAKIYLNQAMYAYQSLGDQWRLASCRIDMARLHIELNNQQAAIEECQLAKDFFQRQEESDFLFVANNVMATAYRKMLMLDRALEILVTNQIKFEELGQLKSLSENYAIQADIWDARGDSTQAKNLKFKRDQLLDSLALLANNDKLDRLALQVRLDKLEQENEILTKKNLAVSQKLSQRSARLSWLTYGGMVLFVVMLIVIYMVRRHFRNRSILLEGEVQELRQQIRLLLEGDTSDLQADLGKINDCLSMPLSDREFEILGHALGDLNNSQIAEQVFVSVNTVKYHLKNIYEKLGVSNRKQVLEYVVRTK